MSALEFALRYRASGLSVLPISADGSKTPDVKTWEPYQKKIAMEEEIRNWYTDPELGVGIVCGTVSGNLFVLDFEFLDFYLEWQDIVESMLPGLLATLPTVLTPGKSDSMRGIHVYVRGEQVVAGGKLAMITEKEAIERTGDKGSKTAIEIRGEGNYVLAPGCPAHCHPSGRLYEPERTEQNITSIPTLSEEEVTILLDAAKALNRDISPKQIYRATAGMLYKGVRPGEDYNNRASWNEVLGHHGWNLYRESRGVSYWTRPGKTKGISATSGFCSADKSGDLLFVFSSNAEPFEPEKAYSKFAAFALLEHAGDFKQAARVLHANGYGSSNPSVIAAESQTDDEEAIEAKPIPIPYEFPLEVLPEKLARFVEAIGIALDCPKDYAGVSMLTIAGAAIGNSRAIEITRVWKEAPRIFAALVGEPGGGKSPSLDLVHEPTIEFQNGLRKQFEAEMALYEVDAERWEAQNKGKKKQVESEIESVSRKPCRPTEQHLYTNDPTMEALMPMLVENPKGFILVRDEIAAWITSMNQYRGGSGSDRQAWLQLWNGATNKSDRKGTRTTTGSMIAYKPFIAVLGGIQPDMMSELTDERGREDGFIHRILFCYPNEHPWSEAINQAPSQELEQAWVDCLHTLYLWEMNIGDDGIPRPHLMRMSEDGKAIAAEWYAQHARATRHPNFSHEMLGPWSKLRSYYFRFALLLHCLRIATGEIVSPDIDAESCQRAWILTEYFISHLRRTYERLQSRREDVKAEKLIAWICRKGGTATLREVVRGSFVRKKTDAHLLLADLKDRGFGEYKKTTSGKNTSWVFTAFDSVVNSFSEVLYSQSPVSEENPSPENEG